MGAASASRFSHVVPRDVSGDSGYPRPAAVLVAELTSTSPDLEEYLLREIVEVRAVATGHPAQYMEHETMVTIVQVGQRDAIADRTRGHDPTTPDRKD